MGRVHRGIQPLQVLIAQLQECPVLPIEFLPRTDQAEPPDGFSPRRGFLLRLEFLFREKALRFDGGGGAGPNYWPNSFGGPAPDPAAGEPPFELSGMAGRYPYAFPNDDFVQPGELYRKVMTDMDRDHLIGNIIDHLGGAAKRIQMRQTALFFKADADYGRRVAAGLGLFAAQTVSLGSA